MGVSMQNKSGSNPKWIKNDRIENRTGPKWVQNWSEMGPKWAQDGLLMKMGSNILK